MNERIYELFEQALKEFKQEHEYATYIVPDPIKEKFAELIVKDIHAYVDSMDTAQVISNGILKRYGVNL